MEIVFSCDSNSFLRCSLCWASSASSNSQTSNSMTFQELAKKRGWSGWKERQSIIKIIVWVVISFPIFRPEKQSSAFRNAAEKQKNLHPGPRLSVLELSGSPLILGELRFCVLRAALTRRLHRTKGGNDSVKWVSWFHDQLCSTLFLFIYCMWLKQCHVYHPPVITIVCLVVFQPFPVMGGANGIVLTTLPLMERHASHSPIVTGISHVFPRWDDRNWIGRDWIICHLLVITASFYGIIHTFYKWNITSLFLYPLVN